MNDSEKRSLKNHVSCPECGGPFCTCTFDTIVAPCIKCRTKIVLKLAQDHFSLFRARRAGERR